MICSKEKSNPVMRDGASDGQDMRLSLIEKEGQNLSLPQDGMDVRSNV